jgi:hypothetical protein
MRGTRSFHCPARFLAATLIFLAGSGAAWAWGGRYDPATGVLTADSVTLGGAVYTGMQVTIGGIASGPAGTFENGFVYSYDTASGQLTVPVVDVGNARYYNVVPSPMFKSVLRVSSTQM